MTKQSVLTLFMALGLGVCSLGLVACGSKSSSSAPAEATETAEAPGAQTQGTDAAAPAETAEPAAETAEQSAPAADAKYAVTIDGARLATNYDGAPAVVVTYTFTNNSDEAQAFATACNETVYQNGVECTMGFGTDYNSEGYMQKVKPGASTTCELLYDLQDTTSPIEVEVQELFSFGDELLAQKTINLQ